MYPAKLAQDEGYHQLVWTDGKTHEYIEESGTMNVMFVIDDVLITPALSDSILAGITRQSVLELARQWGMAVEERKISVKELVTAMEKDKVQEAFGAGTAATIAHIETIGHEGKNLCSHHPWRSACLRIKYLLNSRVLNAEKILIH
ncbi:MAG: aminotransferase class IV [Cytophagales bacterium]|nr:aminotransferase class IV [Cytophagales bacterium]